MRYALLAFALSLVACGTSAGPGSDAGSVTELPDGAPCPMGSQFCGGPVCVAFDHARNCGACGISCPASAPSCELRSGAYACVP
jgi:hypothetical protein